MEKKSDADVVLAGDIGGTKVRLALVEIAETARILGSRSYVSSDYNAVGNILREFQQEVPHTPYAACLGVAGPVMDGRVNVTNLPWVVDTRELNAMGYRHAWLVNDLVAHAAGIGVLEDERYATLQEGEEMEGNRALIAAGTGLGESILFKHEGRWIPSQSEGGHVDFSPTTEEEIELLRFLQTRYKRVSWERVVSGRFGFENLAKFLMATGRYDVNPEFVATVERGDKVGPFVVQAAADGVPLAEEVLRLFSRLYGGEAGNLALKALALGGVYVGGGIAPHILPWLRQPDFIEAFSAKGRFGSLVARIPVKVILDEDNALKGAANYARERIVNP